jgi:ABC-type polysaccharide/polyol phosphate transport system ATPase subunit
LSSRSRPPFRPFITLDNAGVEFRVESRPNPTLKGTVADWLGSRRRDVRVIRALKGVSLSIRSGERVGVIGPNGAGKSTLLKTMAGIYPPHRGTARVEGHVCPLFEFSTGFEMEANGWDNIRTRALLLGMSAREIDDKIHDIATFTDLGEFLDIPVRCYSSGMLLRLAFATSTAVDPQILLLDEVMAAGDAAFIAKARARMDQLMERASIVVFATHGLDALPSFCERTILLRGGEVVADGSSRTVIERYRQDVASMQESA